MIKVYCDICGAWIKKYDVRRLPEDIEGRPVEIGHRLHECDSCENAWERVDIEEVLKKAVLEHRHDIPQNES